MSFRVLKKTGVSCVAGLMLMAGVFGSNIFAQTKISCGKTATASTTLSPASNAVDCNSSSRWESNHGVDPQWIYVNLGTPTSISRVLLNWETASARDYLIEGSNDALFATKTTLATRTNMAYGARVDNITGLSGTYQYIRMYGTARTTSWGYSLFEFEVYDAPTSQYILTTNVSPAGSGSVAPTGGTYNAGTVVTVTATQNPGYLFVNWSGASTSTNPSIQLTMNGNYSLTANFQIVQTSQWLSNGTNLYYNNGNVGIGTNSPTSKLSVLGDVNCNAVRIVQTPAFATLEPNRLLVGVAVGGQTEISGQTVITGNVVASRKIQVDTLQCNALKITGGVSNTLIDIDGNEYHTVTIGTQTWTVENLATTRLNDGTMIPNVTDNAAWSNLTTPGYCWSNNDPATNGATFGALYNWYALNTGKLAPVGWHVSTDAEWTVLENYLIAHGYNYDFTKTGNKIAKSMAARTDWRTTTEVGNIGNNLGRNNRCGFSALPGSPRLSSNGTFYNPNDIGGWWSATESNSEVVWCRILFAASYTLYRYADFKSTGFSVRLVRD
jgi:uncharacterized protein (TIGR02145 family)/uncharacterized repeat protein (TIGR02543 family)